MMIACALFTYQINGKYPVCQVPPELHNIEYLNTCEHQTGSRKGLSKVVVY